MEMPKLAADMSGDMSEAKSELEYNKSDMANEPEATDTVNPEHFASKGTCAECSEKTTLDKNGLCSECKHEMKAAADRHDDVPEVDVPSSEDDKQPKSDLSGAAPEAHNAPAQVDSKTAVSKEKKLHQDAAKLILRAQLDNAVGLMWADNGYLGVHTDADMPNHEDVRQIVADALARGVVPQQAHIGAGDTEMTECLSCGKQLADMDDEDYRNASITAKEAAAGDDHPEEVEFDFGAGDLADIVMSEDADESAE